MGFVQRPGRNVDLELRLHVGEVLRSAQPDGRRHLHDHTFIRWTYDSVGNRLTEARPTGTTTSTYNAADQLTQAGSTTYTYDQNGNEKSAGSRTFTYDLANRLISTTGGSTTTTYTYNGDGLRLQASTGTQASKKTNYLWDVQGNLPQFALERDGNNALLRRYVYGARRISMTTGGSAYYYHYDNLGSVANVTSSTGSSQWTEAYEPFGAIRTETKNSNSAPANFMKFTGEYLDPTGLYYLRARQYDPSIGRFVGPDSLEGAADSHSGSLYAYANDDPTRFTDPTGKGPFSVSKDFTLMTSGTVSPADVVVVLPGDGGGSAYMHYYPFDRRLVIGRIDAGVDTAVRHEGPIFAIGASRVTKVDAPGAWRGMAGTRRHVPRS